MSIVSFKIVGISMFYNLNTFPGYLFIVWYYLFQFITYLYNSYRNSNTFCSLLNFFTFYPWSFFLLPKNKFNVFFKTGTNRSFSMSFKEHIWSLRNSEPKSKFAEHLIDTSPLYFRINRNMDIIHRSRKGRKLDRLEEIKI